MNLSTLGKKSLQENTLVCQKLHEIIREMFAPHTKKKTTHPATRKKPLK